MTGSVFPGLRMLRPYRRDALRADLLGGLTLWAMLVPQSLGFAVLAGMPPVAGLYAAVAAIALYWLWGSSRYLNVGTESTVAIMVATSLSGLAGFGSTEYLKFAALLALLVGAFLLLGGLLRLGRVADFLSRPVLAGYVFGSGVLIITSQLQGFLGISIDPEPYLTKVGAVLHNLDQTAWASVAFGVVSVIVILAMKRFVPLIPGALIAVVASMAVVAAFGVEVAVVGQFTRGLPMPGLPIVGWSDLMHLIGPAAAIALLVYPDSVLTARSLTQGTSDRVDANREFFGIGAANIGSGLMGGFPVNGSQSRSFVLADSGARSQVANLVAAALVIVTLLFLAPVFDYLPVATLAAIVIVAGFGLLELSEFKKLWRYRRSEFVVAVLTIVAVLGLGMLKGIAVAIALTLLMVVLRAASPNTAVLGRVPGTNAYRDVTDHPGAQVVPGLLLYRFDATLFFANAAKMRDEVLDYVDANDTTQVVIDMESIADVDSTAAQVLGELLDGLDRRGIALDLARVRTEIRDELRNAGIEQRLGSIHHEVSDAVADIQARAEGNATVRDVDGDAV